MNNKSPDGPQRADVGHPIAIEPTDGRVRIWVSGALVADSHSALSLHESVYPVVQYVPLKDVDAQVLSRTDTRTHCPYKGDASYYSVTVDEVTVDDVIWTYEDPYPAVSAIAGHVAFYPSKAVITVGPD